MAFIVVNENNRICAASENFHCGPNEIEVTLPENFNFNEVSAWLYKDGVFTYDPIPVAVEQDECEKLRKELNKINEINDMLVECVLELSEIIYGGN